MYVCLYLYMHLCIHADIYDGIMYAGNFVDNIGMIVCETIS